MELERRYDYWLWCSHWCFGPESGAESLQKWVHKATGSDKPQGWGNQLGTDVVGGIQAAHGRKLLQLGQGGNIEQRVSVIGSGLLSSFRTSAKTGLVWQLRSEERRVGKGMR